MLEMGVLKVGRILEAETEESIETDVGDPDEGEGIEEGLGSEEGYGDQKQGCEVSVGGIVENGAETRVGEIAEHEDVRGEEQDGEKKPAGVGQVIKPGTESEDGGTFEMEKKSGSGKHERG